MDRLQIKLWGDVEPIMDGARCLSDKLMLEFSDNGVEIEAVANSCELCVDGQKGKYVIRYGSQPEFFRGLAIVVHQIRHNQPENIKQTRQFDVCGVMFDVSRNMVITVDTAKDLIEYMAMMGLNMMMLYTEDTYRMEKYPYFGYMRGAYTKSEIQEIDAYAAMFGIELIPCIQTLSHLETALRWDYAAAVKDTDATLYVGKNETYAMIDEMFRTVRECFSSNRIHIGMDEAVDVGLGLRLKKDGYDKGFDLMLQHIERVCELAEKHGLIPMMWSDMFFKFGKIGGDYDWTSKLPDGIENTIPKNIEMVYWDYCVENSDVTELFLKKHEPLRRKTIFAGGAWTWNRLTINYDKTFSTAMHQLEACKNYGVSEVFLTIWNNTSSLYNLYTTLPAMQMYAEHFYNKKVNREQLADMFEVCTGYSLDDFMALGLDEFSEADKQKYMEQDCCCINSSAQHFFNDILIGLFDKTLSEYDFKSHYTKCAERLHRIEDMGKFDLMFRQGRILADILVAKCGFGAKVTEAYRRGDIKKLQTYTDNIKQLLALYEEYHAVSMEIWHSQNKPFGSEGTDMVLGAAEARLKTAMQRLQAYIDGNISSLPELEAERLYFYEKARPLTETSFFRMIMTAANVWG